MIFTKMVFLILMTIFKIRNLQIWFLILLFKIIKLIKLILVNIIIYIINIKFLIFNLI